ncbi:nucleotidyltransferase family protein [Aquabacterium sp.]|uniref:nucleotidyltransferase domain-containing protein n=1 Tax=Aquabacterium sp. TaxID=1872578 RepID=UPI00378304CF
MRSTRQARLDLLRILVEPDRASHLTNADWSVLVATARDANLLGALATRLDGTGVRPCAQAQRHLEGMRRMGERQHLSIRWEAHQLQDALGPLGIPVVLLKGSAYVMAYPEIGRGRLFGDVDILVPREALGDVESCLMLQGWISAKSDPYDQRYYREWMHELPPMSHVRRGTVLDIHHNILPLTARNAPDPKSILARSRPLPDLPALRVPCPEDLVTHCLTHLVHEGELQNGLRDLNDADRMLRLFARTPGFWERLQAVAAGNDLAGPVALGLRLVARLFETPVPAGWVASLEQSLAPARRWSQWQGTYEAALLAPSPGTGGLRAAWARQRVYLRAHALRMPVGLLARHLARKAWMRQRGAAADSEAA